jgi:hypothetical protein
MKVNENSGLCNKKSYPPEQRKLLSGERTPVAVHTEAL